MEFFSQLHRNARWQWLWLQTSFSLEPNGSCWSSSLWQSPGCKLLPLFYGLKCKEFRNQKRQDRWFKRWDRWTEEDNRVNVDAWKSDLRKLGRVNGLVFSKALSEVSYREEVLNTLCRMMQSSSRDELVRRASSVSLHHSECGRNGFSMVCTNSYQANFLNSVVNV